MRSILAAALLASAPHLFAVEINDLVGVWQSNEEKTLASMEAARDIPEKSRAFFRNGFFGKLVVVVRNDESAIYFINKKPDKLEFRKHKIKKISDAAFEVIYPDSPSEAGSSAIIYIEGNCYFSELGKWKFKEYFCRVQ